MLRRASYDLKSSTHTHRRSLLFSTQTNHHQGRVIDVRTNRLFHSQITRNVVQPVCFTRERCYYSSSSSSRKDDSKSDDDSRLVTTHETSAILPIDFNVASRIQGEESQIVSVTLTQGQVLRAESGAMLYMTEGIEMNTSTTGSSGLKRLLTGQNVFVSDFTYQPKNDKPHGEVGLGTDFPSKILRLNLAEFGGKLVCQRGAYLASNSDINMEMEFTKTFTSGFFGGEGFILLKLEGDGDVFVKGGGTMVKRDLAQGEKLRISSGSLVAMSPTVQYDVETVPGFKNVMFGGEGLFMTTLTGPGSVWLQGMPPDRMVSEIARRVPGGSGIGFGIPIGMGGGGGAEEGTEEEAAGDGVGGGDESEDMVAATDAAVDADRQATVASSGGSMSDESPQEIDPESSEALFGDAAGTKEDTTPKEDDFGFGSQEDTFSTGSSPEPTFTDDSFPDMEESSTFSSENESDFGTQDFKDDTSFSTFGEGSGSGDSGGDVFDAGGGDGGDGEGGIVGVLRTLWDMFTDDD